MMLQLVSEGAPNWQKTLFATMLDKRRMYVLPFYQAKCDAGSAVLNMGRGLLQAALLVCQNAG